MNQKPLTKTVLAGLFLALALILPFFTGQVPEIGNMLCPMHIPVLLCGFFLSWQWGLAVGVTAPLLRSLLFTMPPLYPKAVCMAFELACYGAASGILYRIFPKKKPYLYLALVLAMLLGRGVWGIAMLVCTGISDLNFGLEAFLAGAFTEAVPGIVLQLLLIPPLVMLREKQSKKAK